MNISIKTFILGLSVVPSLTLGAQIPLLNHNFDSDAIPAGQVFIDKISGWVSSGYGTVGTVIPKGDGIEYYSVGNRGQVATLNVGGRFSQTTSAILTQGETYTLTFDVGQVLSQTERDLIVRFKANGLVLSQYYSENFTISPGEWNTTSFSFVATDSMPIGSPLVIEFANLGTSSSGFVNVDNVSLTTAGSVPTDPSVSGIENLTIITENKILNVPSEYPSIPSAVAYLDDKRIKNGTTTTIQVTDCTNQIYSSPIHVSHPDGDKIHILGKIDDHQNCAIQFNDSDGFVVKEGKSVGLIDGFQIQGTHLTASSGVLAEHTSFIRTGPNLSVSGFHYGFASKFSSSLIADGTSSFNNGIGYFAETAYLQMNQATAYGNSQVGVLSLYGGMIKAVNSIAENNTQNGYYANVGSNLESSRSIAKNNGNAGFGVEHGSTHMSRDSSAINNKQGFLCGDESYLDTTRSNASDNEVTDYNPELRVTGNYGCLIK